RIAGAGLDVYEHEPAMAPGLADCPNAVLLPHIGSATHATRDRMATMAAENALAHLRGERAPNCVNPEGYDAAAYRARAGPGQRGCGRASLRTGLAYRMLEVRLGPPPADDPWFVPRTAHAERLRTDMLAIAAAAIDAAAPGPPVARALADRPVDGRR